MFWSPIICFDSTIISDQNKLSVIKTFDNCVNSKADVWATNPQFSQIIWKNQQQSIAEFGIG